MNFLKKTLHIFTTTFLICFMTCSSCFAHKKDTSKYLLSYSDSISPLCFLDSQKNPCGLIVDIWSLWSKYSHNTVAFKFSSWDDSIKSVIYSDADIQAGMFQTEERLLNFDYADSYMELGGGVFWDKLSVGEKFKGFDNVECGVIKGGYSKKYLEDNHPYVSLIVYQTVKELSRAISEGRVTVFVADGIVGERVLSQLTIRSAFGYKNLFVRALAPAVAKGNIKLIKEINLGFQRIPKNELDLIFKKWNINPHPKIKNADLDLKWYFFSVGVLLLLFFVGDKQFAISSNLSKGQ